MLALLAALALTAEPPSAWARPASSSVDGLAQPAAEAGLRLDLGRDAALVGTVDAGGEAAGLRVHAPKLGPASLELGSTFGFRGVGQERQSQLALDARTVMTLSPHLALWGERAVGLRMGRGGHGKHLFGIGRLGLSRSLGTTATLEPMLEMEGGPELGLALWHRAPPRTWPFRLGGGLGLRWSGPARLPL